MNKLMHKYYGWRINGLSDQIRFLHDYVSTSIVWYHVIPSDESTSIRDELISLNQRRDNFKSKLQLKLVKS